MIRTDADPPAADVSADRVKAVVLDWAGTVVDFGSLAPARTLQRLFAQYGIDLSPKEARQHMGLAKKEHIRGILSIPQVREHWAHKHGGEPGEAEVEAMYAGFIPLQFECLMEFSQLIPGVADTVAALRARDIKIGSTTGYTREMLDMLLAAVAHEGYAPDCTVAPSEVGGGRPHPFMMFECAVRLGVAPMSSMVKAGDTPADIGEALNAGSWAVGVAATGNAIGLSQDEFAALAGPGRNSLLDAAREELGSAGAHYVIDSVADLLPVIDDIDRRLQTGN